MENEKLGHKGETCIICEKIRMSGIHIFDQFICNDCENTLIRTDTDDDRYKYYLKKMRKVNPYQKELKNHSGAF